MLKSKKLLLSVLAAGSFLNASENLPFGISAVCDKVLTRTAYTSCINYDAKNPDWVSYTITSKQAAKRIKRSKDNFKEDKEIPIAYRSQLHDYKRKGFNRGHLMPYALADYSKKTVNETYLLSNIVPQLPNHNQVVWRELESKVRKLLKKEESINIVTGVIYYTNHKTIGNAVAVPDMFYKVIYSLNSNKMYGYLLPHKKLPKNAYRKYNVSIREIEEFTGIDFYPQLNDKVEIELENEVNSL